MALNLASSKTNMYFRTSNLLLHTFEASRTLPYSTRSTYRYLHQNTLSPSSKKQKASALSNNVSGLFKHQPTRGFFAKNYTLNSFWRLHSTETKPGVGQLDQVSTRRNKAAESEQSSPIAVQSNVDQSSKTGTCKSHKSNSPQSYSQPQAIEGTTGTVASTTNNNADSANEGDTGLASDGETLKNPQIEMNSRYLVGFTCKVCNHRQYKTVSKKAYTSGVVLIKCDGCQNRHLFADHLGWFRDNRLTIEDIMRENGEQVKTQIDQGLFDYFGTSDKQEIFEMIKPKQQDPNQNQDKGQNQS